MKYMDKSGQEYEETGEVHKPNMNDVIAGYFDEGMRAVLAGAVIIDPYIEGGVRKILRRVLPSQEMDAAAFYRHVWGFPPPFEVGVKVKAISTEHCPCCKGRKVFRKNTPIMGGMAFSDAPCPECGGKGYA